MTENNKSIDIDDLETQEWLDALEDVLDTDGVGRVEFLVNKLIESASQKGAQVSSLNTAYVNTITTDKEAKHPGNLLLERKIRAIIRWNALVMVVKAVRKNPDIGGHIGTFASSATLYDIGFNHFWKAQTGNHEGDLIYIQGHASPGIYARSFLEGRLTEEQITNFRLEVDGKGVSSYPHPWLMPDYWQFPTVSMGLGPLQAIYQARYIRYLEARGLTYGKDRFVWCFCGDGEMDEPESLGALSVAGREGLDNLVFVVNCNLQRLDGPVRGNAKIVQELEAVFKGAGWNVLKVLWGESWDPLFEKDETGILTKRMNEAVDGEYQNYKAKNGAYTREHFFGKYPELKELVADLTDDQIWRLKRGGHDAQKVYAAYHQATQKNGKPTVILAKTVKGYGLGSAGEAQNIAHNVKKLADTELKKFRDRFDLPITDDQIAQVPFYNPGKDSEEIKYLIERREQLGGYLPKRRMQADEKLTVPKLDAFSAVLKSSGEREISTTMAFVRIITALCKDKSVGRRIVPIIPDEARTFGMEGLFRQLGIYSSKGQLYTPVDSEQVMYYKESKDGQIFQEGLNEGGAFCSFISAGTSYSNNNVVTIPFYIFYSMFGFQRTGDLAWAAGDCRTRGFLIGATSGRTTLNGEGLQHEDGHSHILAGTIPNCRSYDPTYGYELAVIIQDGMKNMVEKEEDVFYYITVMNENYKQPEMPEGVEEGILKGMYKFKTYEQKKHHVQLLGSGTIFLEVLKAAEILANEYNVSSDIWSATSFNMLRRDGLECSRFNMLNPDKKAKKAYVTECLENTKGPIVAATDYIKQYADTVREFMPRKYIVLGTDGFGRSDTREKLREFFEVDCNYIVIAALKALVDEGEIEAKVVVDAIKKYGIDGNKSNPLIV